MRFCDVAAQAHRCASPAVTSAAGDKVATWLENGQLLLLQNGKWEKDTGAGELF